MTLSPKPRTSDDVRASSDLDKFVSLEQETKLHSFRSGEDISDLEDGKRCETSSEQGDIGCSRRVRTSQKKKGTPNIPLQHHRSENDHSSLADASVQSNVQVV